MCNKIKIYWIIIGKCIKLIIYETKECNNIFLNILTESILKNNNKYYSLYIKLLY